MANELPENKIICLCRINFWIRQLHLDGKIFLGGENFLAELGRAWGGGNHWVNSMIFERNLKRKNFGKLYM